MHNVLLTILMVFGLCATAHAGARVWIADQGNNQTFNNPNNIIREIDPVNINPNGPDGSNVYVLNTLPSPAAAFLDELTLDDQQRLWCVVKDTQNQSIDGLRRIDIETGAIDDPPGLVTVSLLPGWGGNDFLEGAAWDGASLWITSIKENSNNVLTRVDPLTGNKVEPFVTGTPSSVGFVDIPGNVAQGLVWGPGNNGYGWLYHSDAMAQKIYKLDPSLLFDADPLNDNNIAVQTYSVPFKPKGMDWMGDKIWVAAPAGGPWNTAQDAGIWEFDPDTGATQQLFNTPNWNLDGLAILEGPSIAINPVAIERTIFLGDPITDDVFTIANGGIGTLTYSISENESWLSLSSSGGSSTGEADDVTMTYSIDSNVVGVYSTTVTITSDDAINSPVSLPVTITVESVSPDFDGDGDVDQTDFGHLQECFSGGTNTNPSCQDADVNDDTMINDADLAVFQSCQTGESIMADRQCD